MVPVTLALLTALSGPPYVAAPAERPTFYLLPSELGRVPAAGEGAYGTPS
jgi:hypothetical protein